MKLRRRTLLLLGLTATIFTSAMAESAFPLNTDWPFTKARAKQLQEETAAALNIPTEFRVTLSDDVDIVMVLIPVGEYLMGSTRENINELLKNEPNKMYHSFNSEEQRRVCVSRPFYVSKHEVTFEQWHALLGNVPSGGDVFHENIKMPVTNVSWHDINAQNGFLDKLNSLPNNKLFPFMKFRLPTEAEWEYACRAGTSGDYAGDGDLDNMGWYNANSAGHIHPVGMKTPNAFGLYDMHGNAAEWCSDSYDWLSNQFGDEWIDPVGAQKGKRRIIRGGSWNSNAAHCRSAVRNLGDPERGDNHVGFRIALSVFPPDVFEKEYRVSPGVDPLSTSQTTYTLHGLTYIGSPGAIDRLVHAMNLLYRNQRNYDHIVFWRETIQKMALAPASAKVSAEIDVQPGAHIVQRLEELGGVFYPGETRVLQEQLWFKQQSPDYSRDSMVTYLENILPYWEKHSGRNIILLTLAGLYSEDPEHSLTYYKRVATDRSAPPADRWGMDVQGAWKAIARIYEAQEEYGKAIEAVSNWHVSEPCGTGAGGSMVERWTWLLRLRVKNGENIDELKAYAWQTLRTGELESIWHPTGVADCLIELYQNNYDVLLADAHKTLAILEDEENDEDRKRWRREEVMGVLNQISLRMRLAGPEWRMTAEEARDRQRKQSDSRGLPVEKTVLFDEVPMDFMFIPAGEFLIGSPPDEKGRIPPDEDQDRVRISQPFYVGKYEVTQLQWQKVMGSNPSHFKDKPDSAMRPVDSVSWNDIVQQFLPKIQQYAPSGMRFDLPTEAQWEYACRAGSDTPFHFGETPDHNSANIGEIIEKHTGRWETMPVGSFPSSAWGLYDMHGNVLEWCRDTFSHSYYRSHNAVAVDPVNKGGRGRVIRGGGYSYSSRAERSRSACRLNDTPDRRVAGFRLVLLTHEGNKNDTEQKDALDEE